MKIPPPTHCLPKIQQQTKQKKHTHIHTLTANWVLGWAMKVFYYYSLAFLYNKERSLNNGMLFLLFKLLK